MNEPRDEQPAGEEKLAQGAKTLFDDSVDGLDASTLSRLNQGRQAAIESQRDTTPFGRWARWVPLTGVAAAAVVTVMVMRGPSGNDVMPDPLTASDFEMLLDDQSLEMLEDLEFYSWLEASDLDANGNVG